MFPVKMYKHNLKETSEMDILNGFNVDRHVFLIFDNAANVLHEFLRENKSIKQDVLS